ncbi:MAG: chemotaxis protein CheB [Candidatus Jettenia sp. CY-1]|nr:MAG: chemotaxis protein CheB [Candidatus Jettenia sp. CY-1]
MEKKKKKGIGSQGKTNSTKRYKGHIRSDQEKKPARKKLERKTSLPVPEGENFERKKINTSFPIVGIGASAGGLEALEQFFTHMPSNSGAAYVVVQHLDPTHSSIMADLLKRFTSMKVVEVEDGMHVDPNRVYVIPPNKDMIIQGGILKLTVPIEPHGLRMPIDLFLRSLAGDCGERAICVILSGSGTDGTLGLKAINEAGGLSLVQSPATAKYDSMPKSAIKTGIADYILSLEKIPEQLATCIKHFHPKKMKKLSMTHVISPGAIQKILLLLKKKTGNDFSSYKKNTIYRRIERRMKLHDIEDVANYVRYLEDHPDEVQLLFKELLIVVTSFFRDADAFDVLKKKILPGMLEDKPENYTIRIWVPGCATGEEVYSIAIVLREYMDELDREFKVQIFGTDIDESAINVARNGSYPSNIALDVTPRRLRRFFITEDNYYRIKKEIRESVVFAVHNIINDPPFTKMDLISCRNLLIYLDNDLQNKVIPLFQYSLKPGGILFLGPSESIGGFVNLFTALDKKWKFFKSKGTILTTHEISFTERDDMHAIANLEKGINTEESKGIRETNIEELAHKVLMESFAPPCVIVNAKGDILYIHGRTGNYLEPAHGEASLNIIDMAREGIRYELHSAIHNAFKQKKTISYEKLRVKTNGDVKTINLTVKPVTESKTKQPLLLVIFTNTSPNQVEVKKGKGKGKSLDAHSRRIEILEWELKYTKDDLQATIAELQASNEELKSLNEEMQSTNEELQSTNEELETSKEELQSVNEELITVNSELQSKIELLSRSENDMKNLLDSIKLGTIFLDSNLFIKRFTVEATKVFNLIPSDIGRPIGHIVSNLEYENLTADVHLVLDKLVTKEIEVQTKDNHWYLMRIMPYRTQENVIDGVVVTFTDVDQIKRTEDNLRKLNVNIEDARKLAEGIIETTRESLIVLDSNLRVVMANRSFCKMFHVSEEETTGRYFYDLGNNQWNISGLRKLLEDILPKNTSFEGYEIVCNLPQIGKRTLLLNAHRIIYKGEKPQLILLSLEDVTDQKRPKGSGVKS